MAVPGSGPPLKLRLPPLYECQAGRRPFRPLGPSDSFSPSPPTRSRQFCRGPRPAPPRAAAPPSRGPAPRFTSSREPGRDGTARRAPGPRPPRWLRLPRRARACPAPQNPEKRTLRSARPSSRGDTERARARRQEARPGARRGVGSPGTAAAGPPAQAHLRDRRQAAAVG